MLEIIRTNNGTIKGVCEWYLVNIKGEYDITGDMVWVNEVEVAPDYRHEGLMFEFAKMIIERCPQAKFAYFYRQRKYPNRKIRIYHKARWLKLLQGRHHVTV